MVVSVTAKVRMFETGGSKSFVSVFGLKMQRKKVGDHIGKDMPKYKIFCGVDLSCKE